MQSTDLVSQEQKRFSDLRPDRHQQHFIEYAIVFFLAYLLLFLGMSRQPNIYDEGLVLTAAMRVAAGQIPHRDFYANYGPAQFYVLAGLFKTFGYSLFVERLYDLGIKAFLIASVYGVTLLYCRRAVASVTAAVAVLWLFSVNGLAGTPVIPVGLFNLAGIALILPAFKGTVSRRRLLAGGAAAGLSALFRYDTGVALLAVEVLVLAIAAYALPASKRMPGFLSTLWPCVLAFAAVTVPFAIAYLAVAPLHAVAYDIILYPAKYYHRGRNLPMPRIRLKHLETIELYLLMAVVAVSLYASQVPRFRVSAVPDKSERPWRGFLIAYGLLSFVMYFKGVVRMELPQMYLSILPSLLLTAVLFQNRSALPKAPRFAVLVLVWLSAVSVIWSTLNEMRRLQVYHFSVGEYLVRSMNGTVPALQQSWCKTSNPLTRGFCFLVTNERMQTIEFIDSHTAPDQRLYVGLPSHDKIFANDNLTYFGAKRLPATMWSHFDPGLQNSYDVQAQMVRELKQSAPPYIVLDAEFAHVNEPNDSSLGGGVGLLDDYLRSRYAAAATFGTLAIWKRIK